METHHNNKIDAPSGTANTILETIQEERDVEPVYGREGHAPARRTRSACSPAVPAMFAASTNSSSPATTRWSPLSHRAEDRGVFAAGALDAAAWLAGRDPEWYSFGEVIDDT